MLKKKVAILRAADDIPRQWEVKCPCCLSVWGKTIKPYSQREIKRLNGYLENDKYLHLCDDCHEKYLYGSDVRCAALDSLEFYNQDTGEMWSDIEKRNKGKNRNKQSDD